MRRTDRLGVRQIFNPLRETIATFVQWIMNRRRRDEGFKLAEERTLPNEEAATDSIIEAFGTYMRQHYRPGDYERGGNTKTHGIVRAEFIVHDDLPPELRHGVFANPKTYKAWVRFAGPGPDMPKDIDDVGFVSCSIKVIGVEGPKLMEDEKDTQDFIMVSHADLRHARHLVERAAAGLCSARDANLLFPHHRRSAFPRFHHAGPVERDADQPARGALTGAACPICSARGRR